MEVKMKNSIIFLMTIGIVLVSLVLGTIYKAYKTHNDRLLLVAQKKIIESAITCVNEDKCSDEKITIGTLISEGYLTETINPLTKIYYSHDSYVIKESNEYHFIEI